MFHKLISIHSPLGESEASPQSIAADYLQSVSKLTVNWENLPPFDVPGDRTWIDKLQSELDGIITKFENSLDDIRKLVEDERAQYSLRQTGGMRKSPYKVKLDSLKPYLRDLKTIKKPLAILVNNVGFNGNIKWFCMDYNLGYAVMEALLLIKTIHGNMTQMNKTTLSELSSRRHANSESGRRRLDYIKSEMDSTFSPILQYCERSIDILHGVLQDWIVMIQAVMNSAPKPETDMLNFYLVSRSNHIFSIFSEQLNSLVDSEDLCRKLELKRSTYSFETIYQSAYTLAESSLTEQESSIVSTLSLPSRVSMGQRVASGTISVESVLTFAKFEARLCEILNNPFQHYSYESNLASVVRIKRNVDLKTSLLKSIEQERKAATHEQKLALESIIQVEKNLRKQDTLRALKRQEIKAGIRKQRIVNYQKAITDATLRLDELEEDYHASKLRVKEINGFVTQDTPHLSQESIQETIDILNSEINHIDTLLATIKPIKNKITRKSPVKNRGTSIESKLNELKRELNRLKRSQNSCMEKCLSSTSLIDALFNSPFSERKTLNTKHYYRLDLSTSVKKISDDAYRKGAQSGDGSSQWAVWSEEVNGVSVRPDLAPSGHWLKVRILVANCYCLMDTDSDLTFIDRYFLKAFINDCEKSLSTRRPTPKTIG